MDDNNQPRKILSVEDILNEYSDTPPSEETTVPPAEENEPSDLISPDESTSSENESTEEDAAASEEALQEKIFEEEASTEEVSHNNGDDLSKSEEGNEADEEDEEYDDDDDEYDDDDDEYEDDDEPVKKRRKKGGRLIFALILVTFVISVAVLSAMFVITVSQEILGLARENMEVSIEIPENSGTEAIADILVKEGIIEKPTLFRVVSKMKGADGTYIAGIHKVNPNMTYGDLIEALQEEGVNPREFVTVTFPEGIRLIDAAALLEENGICDADDFIRAFNSTTFGFDFEDMIKSSPQKFYKMEGLFFPDTYDFYLDEDPKNIVKKVFKNFDRQITPNHYHRMEELGLDLEETLTLASIIQREASGSIDMKLVSSVFHNRLNNPDEYPMLQSDPTTNYVEEVIKPNMEIYSQSFCDAYDTYKGSGLPPGPICNPGIDAIEAVLYPRDTSYYYFCSNLETGEFFFAETLAEHEANLVEAGLVD